MNPSAPVVRPQWAIDLRLDRLLGQPVRVAVEAFLPRRWHGPPLPQMIPAAQLILPDNHTAEGRPVFFEGRCEAYRRHIGVVEVTLGALFSPARPANGIVAFRGRSAVVLPGPALVRLAVPFVVERLPADEANYRRDLRLPTAQLEWPW